MHTPPPPVSSPLPSPPPTANPTETSRTWAQRWHDLRIALRNVPRALALVWRAHWLGTLALLGLTIIAALLPAAQAWIAKLVVDAVLAAIQAGTDPLVGVQQVAPLLVIGFVLITLAATIAQAYTLLEHMLNARLAHTINEALLTKAIALELRYFEDAEFYNKLQNARREADFRALAIVNNLFSMLQSTITLLSFSGILLLVSPLITLILIGATLPAFLVQARYAGVYFRLLSNRAPEFRRMQYIEYLLTVDSTVKEIKLFGLGQPLFHTYQQLFWQFYREDAALARRRSLLSVLWGTLATASFYGAYAWVVWRTIAGDLTLGDLTLYLVVFQQTQSTFRSLLSGAGQLYEGALFLDNLFTYLAQEPQLPIAAQPRRVPRPLQHGIEFRGVSFYYPGSAEWAVYDINLHIKAGETVALVGRNGAGKTTLIKLLARFYDPVEGQIFLDGVDLREYDLDDLRHAVSVIFQDFVQYQAPLRDNIGYGQVERLHDDARIRDAAAQGGADAIADALPQSYATLLGRWFAGGQELSGGQWQKVALARAFMREAEILVLDEPTAALDAEHEYELFTRFQQLTQGKTTLLISHRFSTVRMADRIVVLADQQIVEVGTHTELLAYEGHYARLFRLQAQGYR